MEGPALGGQAAGFHEAIMANIFVAINKRLNAAFEQVEIPIAVQVGQAIEMAHAEVALGATLTEQVTIPNQTVVALGSAALGRDRIKINRVVGVVLVQHDKMQRDLGAAIQFVEAMGHERPGHGTVPGGRDWIQSDDFERMLVENRRWALGAQSLLKVKLHRGRGA